MRRVVKLGTGFVAAIALVGGHTAAVASSPSAPLQINSWQALAMLSGGPAAAAYCGAAVAGAAQAAAGQAAPGCVLPVVDAPPPPPQPSNVMVQPVPEPLPGAAAGVGTAFNPLYLLLGAAALGALAYFIFKGSKDDSNSPG